MIEVLSTGLKELIDQHAKAELMNRPEVPGATIRLDSVTPGTGIFFQRQLEFIFPEVLRTRLPAMNALRLFPQDNSVPAGAETYTHRMYEPLGLAQWVSNEADDIPFADVASREEVFKLKALALGYKYSIFDILRAQMTGTSLPVERGISARRGVEEMQNRVFWDGDSAVGIYGILNFPYTPHHVFAGPISSATAADDIIAYLNSFCNAPVSLTKNVEKPTTLLLATTPYSYISSTPRSANTDTTILKFFLDNNPYINRVESVHELENAGPDNSHLAVAYTPDKRVGKLVMAQPFTQLPAQQRNLAFVVPAYSKIGGFCSMYPLAMAIGEIPAS